jgi:hypothetical protein
MSLIPGVPDDVVNKVVGLLTEGRSCVIGIINQTGASLQFDASNTSVSHGGLLPPPEQIAPNAIDAAGAHSGDNSLATGCEGIIVYQASDGTQQFQVNLHYDNPFAGGNSADGSVSISDYTVDAWAGPGDSQAPMRFVLRPAS